MFSKVLLESAGTATYSRSLRWSARTWQPRRVPARIAVSTSSPAAIGSTATASHSRPHTAQPVRLRLSSHSRRLASVTAASSCQVGVAGFLALAVSPAEAFAIRVSLISRHVTVHASSSAHRGATAD
ncbi:hypothetical protein QF027_009786 [Streptomyces canus]|nr:hypothetical protein [Streptomyces canus]